MSKRATKQEREALALEVERFWLKVNRRGPLPKDRALGACQIWTGAKSTTGGGQVRFAGAMMGAHRASWLITHGTIPARQRVRQVCGNLDCVNPAHLQLGELVRAADGVDKFILRFRHGERAKLMRVAEKLQLRSLDEYLCGVIAEALDRELAKKGRAA